MSCSCVVVAVVVVVGVVVVVVVAAVVVVMSVSVCFLSNFLNLSSRHIHGIGCAHGGHSGGCVLDSCGKKDTGRYHETPFQTLRAPGSGGRQEGVNPRGSHSQQPPLPWALGGGSSKAPNGRCPSGQACGVIMKLPPGLVHLCWRLKNIMSIT